jgi:hypothetical protein
VSQHKELAMAGSLDLTTRWSNFRRQEDDMSVDFICALLPQDADGRPTVSASLFRQCLAGTRNLDGVYHKDLEGLLQDLKAIVADASPYPVRWGDVSFFRNLLAERRRAKANPVRSPFTEAAERHGGAL